MGPFRSIWNAVSFYISRCPPLFHTAVYFAFQQREMDATSSSSSNLHNPPQVAYSTRSQSKKRVAQPESSGESNKKTHPAKRFKLDHDTEKNSSKNKKIASKSKGQATRKNGRLEEITEMPMDVLYEIFGYLEPLDVLHLSWSSKALRLIVMGKSAKYVWENVGA